METVVIIIMLLVSFSLMLKLTYLPLWGRVLICVVLALFTGMSWEFASGQSKTQIDVWIHSPELMLDMAVLLTVDVFIQITFCVAMSGRIFGERQTKALKIFREVTLWIPGILIFPTLLALVVEVIFSFPGVDFSTITWCLAGGILVAGVALSSFIGFVLPEKDLRLELIFMVNTLIALLGVVATVNGRTAVAGVNSVDWETLAGVMGLLILGAAGSFVYFKLKQNKQIKSK